MQLLLYSIWLKSTPLLLRVPDDDRRRWAGFNQIAIVLGIVERLLYISDK